MARNIVINWKTTITGVASVVLGAMHTLQGQSDGIALIASGLGLMFAQDGV